MTLKNNPVILYRSDHFKKCFKKLPRPIQDLFEKKLSLMIQSGFSHPSLRIKKMKGTDDIWEASLNMNYRLTFQFVSGGILFRKIGTHNILNNP